MAMILPNSVRLMITSRPETAIKVHFRSLALTRIGGAPLAVLVMVTSIASQSSEQISTLSMTENYLPI